MDREGPTTHQVCEGSREIDYGARTSRRVFGGTLWHWWPAFSHL